MSNSTVNFECILVTASLSLEDLELCCFVQCNWS